MSPHEEYLAFLEAALKARREARGANSAAAMAQFREELRLMAERSAAVAVSHYEPVRGTSSEGERVRRWHPDEDLSVADRLARMLFWSLEPAMLASEEAWLDEWFAATGYAIRVNDFRQASQNEHAGEGGIPR